MRQFILIFLLAGILAMFSRSSWAQRAEVTQGDNQTITGPKTFNPPNVNQIDETHSGNEMRSGKESHPGTELSIGENRHSGSETFSGITNVVYVGGSITSWAGSDIGAQINSAYASCPATGCRIHILPGACYLFSRTISLNTKNKPALLEGDPGATCLNYIGTGTAIILDYGGAYSPAGIRDINLTGPGTGGSSVGVNVGPTNGAESAQISGLHIGGQPGGAGGFATAVIINPLGFHSTIRNSALFNSGICLSFPAGTENPIITDSVIAHCTTGLNIAATNNNSDIHLTNVAFDDNNTGINIPNTSGSPLSVVSCLNCHFENGSVTAGGSAYALLNSGVLMLYGGSMLDDRALGTSAQMIQASGHSYLSIMGTVMFSNGVRVTQAVKFAGSARGFLAVYQSSLAIASIWNKTYTGGPVYDGSLQGSGALGNLPRVVGSGIGTSAGTAIAPHSSQSVIIAVTGATIADTASCATNAFYPANWASIGVLPPIVTANTVTVTIVNPSAGSQSPGAVTFRCTVFR